MNTLEAVLPKPQIQQLSRLRSFFIRLFDREFVGQEWKEEWATVIGRFRAHSIHTFIPNHQSIEGSPSLPPVSIPRTIDVLQIRTNRGDIFEAEEDVPFAVDGDKILVESRQSRLDPEVFETRIAKRRLPAAL